MEPVRTHLRIDLGRIAANFRAIQEAVGSGVDVLAVVKANAYGHGAVEVSDVLAKAGCGRFAVASLDEGAELRASGIAGEIVVLGGFVPGQEAELVRLDLTPMLYGSGLVERWRKAAQAAERKLPCHLELDTGMTRVGLRIGSGAELAGLLGEAPELALQGIATHLAAAEDFEDPSTEEQFERFRALLDEARAAGLDVGQVHVSNSAAAAYRPLDGQTMIRSGFALYGYLSRTVGEAPEARFSVEKALEWRAAVLDVRDVAAGDRLGYNGTYTAERDMRIAVLGAGYGDGYRRELSNGGEVLLGGRRRTVVGRVSMDFTLVDATEVQGVAPGDEAILLGEGLDAQDLARRCGTVAYEILTGLSGRVPRVFLG